ncbi:hypothetical protein [uncultured Stenotrophomonas sp.]|uniref:hypothetical protein n=1 Tax=uncultured Stenotrophomonas sp. TaxID=165438 RepID=UPI0025FC6244|nr:hypothetical protein [uncultured Stenotrophomonas sp.]
MNRLRLLVLASAPLPALAAADLPTPANGAVPADEITEAVNASFQRYVSLLLAADPVARRTLDAQWKGTYMVPGYLDRLQQLRARMGDHAGVERVLADAGFETPGLAAAALDRLGRVTCTATSVRADASSSTAILLYHCSVPDLGSLYARYKEATSAGIAVAAPAALADLYRRQASLLQSSRSRSISGDLVFFRQGGGAWLTSGATGLKTKLLDAFMPYPAWRQRMLEEAAPKLTGSPACDWPLHRFGNCLRRQSPQRMEEFNVLQADVLDRARDMDQQELLDYCVNQVSAHLHFEYRGLTCP